MRHVTGEMTSKKKREVTRGNSLSSGSLDDDGTIRAEENGNSSCTEDKEKATAKEENVNRANHEWN
jgi:hypothetical protein